MNHMPLSLDQDVDISLDFGAQPTSPNAASASQTPAGTGRHWWPGAWETVDPEATARERQELAELAALRASIERLRREREKAIGQFHALIRPMAEPAALPFRAAPVEVAPPSQSIVERPPARRQPSPWELDHPGDPLAGLGLETIAPCEASAPEEAADAELTPEALDPVDEFEALTLRVREACARRQALRSVPKRRPAVPRFQFAAASLAAIAVSGSLATARTPLPIGRHETVRRLVPSPWDGRLLAAWSTVVALRPASAAPRADAPVPSRPLPFDPASVKPAWVQAGMVGTTAKATKSRVEQVPAPLGAGDGETEDQNP